MTSTAYDRNADGKDDVVYEYKGNSHGLPSWIMILMGISRLRFSTTKLVRLFARKSIAVGPDGRI